MNTRKIQNSALHTSKQKPLSTTLYSTAAVVTSLSVAERALGFLYRIVLSRLIGAEALGIYQVALSVFAVFLTLGTGGIPITVSRLISKGRAENNAQEESRAVGAGIALSLLLTVPVLLLCVSNFRLTFLFSDERCLPVFRILLLGLVFSSLYAVMRGSFWGKKQFLAPSVMEIAEESVMVIAGILLLQRITSPLDGAKYAAWAAVISYIFSFSVSFFYFFFRGGKIRTPKGSFKPLYQAVAPITLVRTSGTLINSAVSVLLPVMLIRAGMSKSQALADFGVMSGMVLPVLMIPATVIGSLSLVLVPELSEDYFRKNHAHIFQNLARGIKAAMLLSMFLLPFFYAFGNELGMLAFSNALAGEMIKRGCVLLLPMSVAMITTSMLNALGKEKQTFIVYFISAACLLACVFFLPAVCGIYAYLIGMIVNFTVCCICNLFLLYKYFRKFYAQYGKGLLGAALRAFIAVLPLSVFGRLLTVLFQRVFGALLAMFFTGVVLTALSLVGWLILKIVSGESVKARFLAFLQKRRRKL